MDMSQLNRYLDDYEVVLTEDATLRKTIADLEKTMKKLEKNKAISADILMGFRKLTKNVENVLNNPATKGLKESKINERMMSFGDGAGRLEIFGNDITISKAGKSVSMTKKELADIVIKAGIAKMRKK